MTTARTTKRKKKLSGTGKWDRSKPPQERREEQRVAILYATARVVAAHGFSNTRLADIEQAAGVSRRTIFSHFSSMEDLYVVVHEYAAELAATAVLQTARAATSPRAKVRSALDAYFGLLEEHAGFAAALLREFATLGPRHVAARASLIDALAEFIREVAAEFDQGRFVPQRTLARALVVSIEAAAPVIALAPDASEHAEARAALERMLLVGMGQTP